MTNRIAEITARWSLGAARIHLISSPGHYRDATEEAGQDVEYLLSALTQVQRERDAAKAALRVEISYWLTDTKEIDRQVEYHIAVHIRGSHEGK